MIINVEFFDKNPLENVITSLNYKIDKTIFFGYKRLMEESSAWVERFLKEVCGVQKVEFCTLDDMELSEIIGSISDKVTNEAKNGHDVFFDLTGGESLPLVAFGILSRELNAPMHIYDICSNKMNEYNYEGDRLLSKAAEYAPITLDLDVFISLFGGKINYRMQKDFKNTWSKEDTEDIINMWNLSRKYSDKWVHYSALLRKFTPDFNLEVEADQKKILNEIRKNRKLGGISTFKKFFRDCESLGFLKDIVHDNGIYRYTYKNMTIKNYFWDGGSILEMYAFLKESKQDTSNDCRVGVHIDWDGMIHDKSGKDVLNEIDIMSIRNNIPTFISCKIGNVDQMALYELKTVADRFGGKYAKKVLIVAKDVAPSHLLRAKEMDIEVKRI